MTKQPPPGQVDASREVKAGMWVLFPFTFIALYSGVVGGFLAFVIVFFIGLVVSFGVVGIVGLFNAAKR